MGDEYGARRRSKINRKQAQDNWQEGGKNRASKKGGIGKTDKITYEGAKK